ncbi:hypothetical protein FF041_31515 [Streptomyces jumonjinensis]|uniref:ARB-07466-like C-terminal domain-containing protein n=1 Tax=Streptomyces jumonjinensis TaxID=1945 RepID=A0A646KQD1_STRJU|nr:hypothetical protein [Streptomyces jumonjinensis]
MYGGAVSKIAPPARRGRLKRLTAASAALLAVTGYLAVQHLSDSGAPRCVVHAAPGAGGPSYELSTEMAANAATVAAVGTARGLPERAVTIALATALQESALRNIEYGDRDSLGLFQQRPSKGWGTPEQILDPVYSAGKFYEQLAEVPGYSRLPLTVAAQRVQRSGFPQAYAKHEPDASLLAAALTGRTGGSLNCTTGAGPAGAGDPERVRAELVRDFGPGVLPKVAQGPGSGGVPGAREITVPVPSSFAAESGARSGAVSGGAARRGWELAHWAVARAAGLGIGEVAYGNRVWSAERSDEGWRGAAGGGPGGEGSERTDGDVRLLIAR